MSNFLLFSSVRLPSPSLCFFFLLEIKLMIRNEKAYRPKTLAFKSYLPTNKKRTGNLCTLAKKEELKRIANFARHMLEIETNCPESFLHFLFSLFLLPTHLLLQKLINALKWNGKQIANRHITSFLFVVLLAIKHSLNFWPCVLHCAIEHVTCTSGSIGKSF